MKKLLSIILALAMVFSLSAVAFAGEKEVKEFKEIPTFDKLEISRDKEEEPVIYVAGTDLTTGGHTSDGKVWYNAGTKTLFLDNATIDNFADGNVIYSTIEGLTIVVKGKNSINYDSFVNESAIKLCGDTKIVGYGFGSSLNIENFYCGIYSVTGNVSFSNCTINMEMLYYGIYSENGGITFNNCVLNIDDNYYGGIWAYGNISMNASKVDIESDEWNCINCLYGNLSLKACDVKLNASDWNNGIYSYEGNVLLKSCKLNIYAQNYGISVCRGFVSLDKCKALINSYSGIGAEVYNYNRDGEFESTLENYPNGGNIFVKDSDLEIYSTKNGLGAYGLFDNETFDYIDNGDVVISGYSNIKIETQSSGAIDGYRNVTIKDNANVNAVANGQYTSIWAEKNVTLNSKGTINASSKYSSAIGCYKEGSINIGSKTGKIILNGEVAGEHIGENYGAVETYNDNSFVTTRNLSVRGSEKLNAKESSVTKSVKLAKVGPEYVSESREELIQGHTLLIKGTLKPAKTVVIKQNTLPTYGTTYCKALQSILIKMILK